MVPLRGPPVLLSFRHGASFPFRSVPPVPPPAPPARRTLYRAYPARARAGVSAGAVRAPDCPRGRQAQGAPLPSAESGSFRAAPERAGGGPWMPPLPDPSYHGFSRPGPGKGETLPEFNEHPVAALHRPGLAPAGPALPRAAPIRHPGPRALPDSHIAPAALWVPLSLIPSSGASRVSRDGGLRFGAVLRYAPAGAVATQDEGKGLGGGKRKDPRSKAGGPTQTSRNEMCACRSPRAGVHPRLPMPPQPVESWSDCRGCRENRRWPPAFERVKKSDLSGFTLAVRAHPVTPDLIRGPSLTGCASRSRSRGNRTVGACPGPRSGARRENRRWTPDQVRGDDVYLSSSPFDTPAPSPSAPARRAVCCVYATVTRFFSCGGKKACALAGPGYAFFSLW